jgi:uncharacterized membrane protein YfcA
MIEAASAAVLLAGVFAGAVVSSFSGFAFAPVAGVLLLTSFHPALALPVLMMCSVIVQVATLIHLRRSLRFRSIGAMLMGGALGVPLALILFHRIDPDRFQVAFAIVVAAYAIVMLLRPHGRVRLEGGPGTELAVGFGGGLIGGLTAMPGAVPVLYCDCKGCSKEVQRATVQPFILAMQLLALALLVATGSVGEDALALVAMSLPAVAAGITIGLLLFGRVPDAAFRRAVLIVLLATSAGLIAKPGAARTTDAQTLDQQRGSKLPAGAEISRPHQPVSAHAPALLAAQ